MCDEPQKPTGLWVYLLEEPAHSVASWTDLATSSARCFLTNSAQAPENGSTLYPVILYSVFADRLLTGFQSMSVPLHHAPGTFAPGALPCHVAEGAWHGTDLGEAACRTGFDQTLKSWTVGAA